jgi:hypothetical protein
VDIEKQMCTWQIYWNTLKYTINALRYIEIHYQYNEVYYKCTQMHWKKIQLLWCLLKYIYLPLIIHSYILIYIKLPSKYITLLPKTLHTSDTYYNTITIFQYPSIYFHVCWNCLETSLFRTSLSYHYPIFQNCLGASLFSQNVVALAITYLLESKNEVYSMNPIILLDN